jgi:excinuclease UvrABC nuclease subunit
MNQNLKPFCHRDPDNVFSDILEIQDFSDIPTMPGAYIFASHDQKFIYPNGQSKIIYIGKAINLRRRIQTHRRVIYELKRLSIEDRNSYWYYPRYQYLTKFGAKLFYFTIRGTQDEQNLENKLLEAFYDRFLSLPVGNGAISYKK